MKLKQGFFFLICSFFLLNSLNTYSSFFLRHNTKAILPHVSRAFSSKVPSGERMAYRVLQGVWGASFLCSLSLIYENQQLRNEFDRSEAQLFDKNKKLEKLEHEVSVNHEGIFILSEQEFRAKFYDCFVGFDPEEHEFIINFFSKDLFPQRYIFVASELVTQLLAFELAFENLRETNPEFAIYDIQRIRGGVENLIYSFVGDSKMIHISIERIRSDLRLPQKKFTEHRKTAEV